MISKGESTARFATGTPDEVTADKRKASPNGTKPGMAGTDPRGSTVTVTGWATAPGAILISALPRPARTRPPVSGRAGALADGGSVDAPATVTRLTPVRSASATTTSVATLEAGTRAPPASTRSADATTDQVPRDRRKDHSPVRAPPRDVDTRTCPVVRSVATTVAPATGAPFPETVPETVACVASSEIVTGPSAVGAPDGTGSTTWAASPAACPVPAVA